MYVQFVDRSRVLRGAFCVGPYHPGAVEGWVVGLYRSCAVEGWVVGLYRSCAGLYCAFRPPLKPVVSNLGVVVDGGTGRFGLWPARQVPMMS
ncbi:hypothetical protein Zmor_022248 [Zophobas morio]|uniref:Uncharacterized protein n=1 Tax=Zophobas morio TaxID=2755281 RepID=A0AA38HVE5_9CUCU|nr:hypothetical protein Zmor_022248 [Zophobas morio]